MKAQTNQDWKTEKITGKQKFLLYKLTNEDYKNSEITRGEASELISKILGKAKEIFKKNDEVADIVDYMKKNADAFITDLENELGIKSVITNDVNHNDKLAYLFVGGGCGMAWIEYDKRSKVAKDLFDGRKGKYYVAVDQFKKYAMKEFIDEKVKVELRKNGFPIEALFAQSLALNTSAMGLALGYVINKYNLKRVWLRNRID